MAQCGASSSAKGSVLKKSLYASEQDRADIARRRAQWKKYQGRLDPKRLVLIDNSWGIFEFYRRCAQELEEQRKPQPVQTTWAVGSMEWLAEQSKSK